MQACCPNIALNCNVYYPFSANLEGVIGIPIGLYGTFYVWIQDRYNNWQMDVATCYNSLLINTADFPAALFSWGLTYTVFLSSDINGQVVVPFSVSMTTYEGIILSINEPTYLVTEDGCNLKITEDGQNFIQTE